MFVVNRSSVSIPMYEFPCSFSSGLHTAILSLPGMMATTPPPTPLLPGIPTRKANSPDSS